MQISEATITELQNAMQKREITAKELALCYLSRIAAFDKGDGGLNAVLEINPDALAVAERLDRLRQCDAVLGPLHGIPVMLKDNICTDDKMHTSAGSAALEDNYSPYDAALVRRLRSSGAVILGKTNMTEFANSMAKGMPSGYSSRGGQTFNPYDRGADPSGSSTGSAVAVSANLCTAAVGTETCGSIISPAQHNGVVGLKPTLGLVSGHGVIPISHTLDTAGPIARTVTDAAILLGALAEADETGVQTHSYTGALDTSALKGLRVGIFRMFTEDCDSEQLTMSENIVTVLRENGAACVEIPPHTIRAAELFPIMRYEFKCDLNAILETFGRGNTPRNLREIIRYNEQHPERALKYGQDKLLNAQNDTSGRLTEPEYLRALVAREEKIAEFDRLFTDNRVDVIYMLAGGSGLAILAGFPIITIPIGTRENGLPVGSCWVARRYQEAPLLQAAYAVEQMIKARRDPLRGL